MLRRRAMASNALAAPVGGRSRDDRRRQALEGVGGQPVRLRRERGVADRIVKAERIDLRREVAEAANGFGQRVRGDAGLEVGGPGRGRRGHG